MKKRNRLFAVLCCICTCVSFLSCLGRGKNSPADVTAEQLLCIYMCGSDLESKRGAAGQNIAELLAADIPQQTKIILQTGGAAQWRSFDIPSDSIMRYEIVHGKLQTLQKLPQANMGKSDTLRDFLLFCTERYPTAQTSLVLWDHGSGSAGAFCMDENYGMDGLTAQRLEQALQQSLGTGRRLAMLGFDVCLAANFETVVLASQYADHMIASQEIEPLGGWDYRALVESIGSDGFYETVLDAFAKKCEKAENRFYTLSHIDLSGIKEHYDAFDDFAERLCAMSEQSLKSVTEAARDAMSFGFNTKAEGYSDMIDLGDFARAAGAQPLLDVLAKYVTAKNGAYKESACGVSLYYPLSGIGRLTAYLGRLPKGKYRDFLVGNYVGVSPQGLIRFIDSGSERDGELHVSLSSESLKYIQSVEYRAFYYYTRADGYSRWISYGADTDIEDDGEGGYTTSFGAKWVSCGNIFVCCYPIDRVGTQTYFAATCSLNGEEGSVRFLYDLASRKFETLGFLPTAHGQSSERLHSISVNSQIGILFYELLANGRTQLCSGANFYCTPNDRFSVETVPNGEYRICVVITDIFGRRYVSDTAELIVTDGEQKLCSISIILTAQAFS